MDYRQHHRFGAHVSCLAELLTWCGFPRLAFRFGHMKAEVEVNSICPTVAMKILSVFIHYDSHEYTGLKGRDHVLPYHDQRESPTQNVNSIFSSPGNFICVPKKSAFCVSWPEGCLSDSQSACLRWAFGKCVYGLQFFVLSLPAFKRKNQVDHHKEVRGPA